MLIRIPNVLTKAEVAEVRRVIDAGPWVDGNETSGAQAAQAKANSQLAEDSQERRAAGDFILDKLEKNGLFITAALPLKVYPPLFNRYEGGQTFANHVDNAIRPVRGQNFRIRTDVSATLFLAEPEDYDGGELVIDDTYGPRSVKLSAGDMVVYPSTSLHRVMPVTRGARVGAFFWIQSMVREDAQRSLLFDLDASIQELTAAGVDNPAIVRLTGVYHNLIRRWAEV